jgi:hypothetical protein
VRWPLLIVWALPGCEFWGSAMLQIQANPDAQSVSVEVHIRNLSAEFLDCDTRAGCVASLSAALDPAGVQRDGSPSVAALLGEHANITLRQRQSELDVSVRYQGPVRPAAFAALGFGLDFHDGAARFTSDYWTLDRAHSLPSISMELDGEAVAAVRLPEDRRWTGHGSGSADAVPLLLSVPGMAHAVQSAGLLDGPG